MGAYSRLSSIIFLVSFILSARLNVLVRGEYEDGNSTKDLCSTDLSIFLPLPYSDNANMMCKPVWNSYLLRYSRSKDNVITIVLSTIYTSGWVGIGFSRDGMMLNASCIVGWVKGESGSRIKQYYIEGFTPSKIIVDKGELPLTSVPPFVVLHDATIYLAFQLKYSTNFLKNQPILLAFGTKYPKHHLLTPHDDKISIAFDFSSEESASVSPSVVPHITNLGGMKKTHGILVVLGWGVLIPFGALFARYLKHRDPLWYYLHVIFQFVGWIFGFAAMIVGLSLDHKLHADISPHKGIGIFVFVLSILQVLAFFVKPNKDSKKRKMWNWYHHWVGRIAIVFAAVNMILGIHYSGAVTAWKIGCGFVLSMNLLLLILLEVLSRLRRSKDPTFPEAASQMNTF